MISDARKARGLTQKELAARIRKENGEPISAQYLNDIEHDRRNAPSEYFMRQFALALDLPKDYLSLSSGTIPEDVRENVVSTRPEEVEEAFKAFRRAVRKK